MPNVMAVIMAIPVIFDYLINFEYKTFLISCSYVYYYTIFFWLIRVLIYCGLSLVNLINTKHTTLLKKNNKRSFSLLVLKFFQGKSLKENFLKTAVIIYL